VDRYFDGDEILNGSTTVDDDVREHRLCVKIFAVDVAA
jgi:hypothetical protein